VLSDSEIIIAVLDGHLDFGGFPILEALGRLLVDLQLLVRVVGVPQQHVTVAVQAVLLIHTRSCTPTALQKTSVADPDPNPDLDPSDPYVFWASWIRIRIH
jgi:hypothetical protein